MTGRTLAAAAIVVVISTAFAQPHKAPPPKAVVKDKKPDLLRQLSTRITVDLLEGPFPEIVANFSDRYHITIVIDRSAFETGETGENVKLTKLTNIRLDSALKLLAQQVKGTVLVYPEYVKIVPDVIAAYETGLLTVSNDPDDVPLISMTELTRSLPLIKRALVSANFKNKPLSEILDEIAESTGATVNLSPGIPANERDYPLTARFANTPVDAAVRTLCEMANLGVIEDANALLVTTRERAAARASQDAQKMRAKQGHQVLGGLGGVALQPDMTTEIIKLKDQNEQLRRQIEELRKSLGK